MCDRCEPASAISSRRDLLRAGMAAAAGAVVLGSTGVRAFVPAGAGESAPVLPGHGKAKQAIFLFMNGGASHFETFDPKPGTTAGGPTKAIPTSVPGVHVAASLPMLAKRMDRLALVRGMSTKEGNHERARYLMHTGYAPTPTVAHPSFGSWLAAERAHPATALPAYVAINGPGAGPGLLGPTHAPFQVRIAGEGGRRRGGGEMPARRGNRAAPPVVQNLEAPASLPDERLDRRIGFLGALNESFSAEHDGAVAEAQGAMFERARRLMDTPKNTAFDLAGEKPETIARYGPTEFGRGCLMARRLLEEGVTCIEVMSNGWDTHDDNFNRVGELNAAIDQGASALLDDLQASGRLQETLVVWLGDFGRTPRITAGDGRGHYPQAWSLWLAGGGVQGGRVVGATSADGSEVVDGLVDVPAFFASLAHATGLDPRKTLYSNGRPISIVDETGLPVPALFTT